jgi:ABC-type transport system involved in multi-copper enzyme maturation permease subunit
MAAIFLHSVRRLLSPTWLTGPIFDKELRVSSRRRRNYLVRFAYVALLTLFVGLVWAETVQYNGSVAYQVSRMSEAGRIIISTIVWFQFCAVQLLAIIMLSTAISDEIYHRTLGVLMTTPINSFQIVMGKLLSKLLQLVLLLALSLSLLTIVRVFGGVPWDYIFSSLCLTLTTVLLVGSLTLFFSIFTRRAYVVIIFVLLTLGFLFAFVPMMMALLLHRTLPEKELFTLIFYPNPYCVLFLQTMIMNSPRLPGGLPVISWPLHAGILLGASAVLLTLSTVLVRRVALRQITGVSEGAPRRRRFRQRATAGSESVGSSRRLRPVKGCPLLWKERSAPLRRRHKVGIVLMVLLAAFTYILVTREGELEHNDVQITYVLVYLTLGMLYTIVLPATCITSEKESRAWPLLLTTTLTDYQIIRGKFLGMLRRCLPTWFFLAGHLIFFCLSGFLHAVIVLQMSILVAWIMVFFCASGIYFSARVKHTITAVILNFTLGLVLWALIPFLFAIFGVLTHSSNDFVEFYCDFIPFVQAVVIIDGVYGRYHWPSGSMGDLESTLLLLISMLLYFSISVLFLWRAKLRLRRNVV